MVLRPMMYSFDDFKTEKFYHYFLGCYKIDVECCECESLVSSNKSKNDAYRDGLEKVGYF